jgi:hypothetical protein
MIIALAPFPHPGDGRSFGYSFCGAMTVPPLAAQKPERQHRQVAIERGRSGSCHRRWPDIAGLAYSLTSRLAQESRVKRCSRSTLIAEANLVARGPFSLECREALLCPCRSFPIH